MRINVRDRRKWVGFTPACIVDLSPVEESYQPTWTVNQDGVEIGRVRKGKRTWERRTAGRRYVNARGQVTAWYWSVPGETLSRTPYDTRNAAIRALLAHRTEEQ